MQGAIWGRTKDAPWHRDVPEGSWPRLSLHSWCKSLASAFAHAKKENLLYELAPLLCQSYWGATFAPQPLGTGTQGLGSPRCGAEAPRGC